jgi:hypothetical protein
MALILNQVAIPVSGSGAVLVATIPPNSTVTLSVPGPTTAPTVYIGQASTVTGTTGFPVNAGGPQVNFFLPPTSQIVTIWATNSSASVTATLGVGITSTA